MTANLVFALIIFFVLLSIVATILWIWMLVHAITKNTSETQIVWIVAMVAFGPIVSIIYYFAVKKPMDNQAFTGSTVKGSTSFK